MKDNLHVAMGAPDIIFALRKLAMNDATPAAAKDILAKHIYGNAARSISYPIETQYSDQKDFGISRKECSSAMQLYTDSCAALFKIMSPGTTEVSKMMPRFTAAGKLATIEKHSVAKHTPELPAVTAGKPANNMPNLKPNPPNPDNASKPQSSAAKKTPMPMAAASNVPPSAHLAGSGATRGGATRKSSINVMGSPHKEDDDDDDASSKKKKSPADDIKMAAPRMSAQLSADVKGHEELASAISSMPTITADMAATMIELKVPPAAAAAARPLLPASPSPCDRARAVPGDGRPHEGKGRIRDQGAEGRAAGAEGGDEGVASPHQGVGGNGPSPPRRNPPPPSYSHSHSHSHAPFCRAQIMQERDARMQAVEKAARAEGSLEQQTRQVDQLTGQMASWVRMQIRTRELQADFAECDLFGSIIP